MGTAYIGQTVKGGGESYEAHKTPFDENGTDESHMQRACIQPQSVGDPRQSVTGHK